MFVHDLSNKDFSQRCELMMSIDASKLAYIFTESCTKKRRPSCKSITKKLDELNLGTSESTMDYGRVKLKTYHFPDGSFVEVSEYGWRFGY